MPSSRYLIDKCLQPIDFDQAEVILEFGVGDGCITEEILQRAKPTTKIIAIEINENLYQYGKEKFSNHANLYLHFGSALVFDKLLETYGITSVDFIVSSLPLSLFKQKDIEELFDKIPHHLSVGGAFIQYQYSIGKLQYLKSVFSKVRIDYTILNTPPALIFTCRAK